MFSFLSAKQDVGGDQFGTKVVVIHNGINRWTAPAIIKSKCFIDMSNFPFDEQVCDLNFGTLTYSTQWVDIESDLRVSDVDQVSDCEKIGRLVLKKPWFFPSWRVS